MAPSAPLWPRVDFQTLRRSLAGPPGPTALFGAGLILLLISGILGITSHHAGRHHGPVPFVATGPAGAVGGTSTVPGGSPSSASSLVPSGGASGSLPSAVPGRFDESVPRTAGLPGTPGAGKIAGPPATGPAGTNGPGGGAPLPAQAPGLLVAVGGMFVACVLVELIRRGRRRRGRLTTAPSA